MTTPAPIPSLVSPRFDLLHDGSRACSYLWAHEAERLAELYRRALPEAEITIVPHIPVIDPD